jgi:O-antigen ligase
MGRGQLAQISWDTFSEHPLFGIGASTLQDNENLSRDVGGHASWVDQLAEYGIVGFGFYLLFLVLGIRRVWLEYRYGDNALVNGGRLVACALFVIAGFVDPVIFNIPLAPLFYFLALGPISRLRAPARMPVYDAARHGSRFPRQPPPLPHYSVEGSARRRQ